MMINKNRHITKGSRIETILSLLILLFFASWSLQADEVLPPATTNINYTVKNDQLEFPVIIRFKGFRVPVLTAEDLMIEKIVFKTNILTNMVTPVLNRTNETKTKKSKKKPADEQAYTVGLALFNNRMYAPAEDQFKLSLSTAPGGKFSDDANIYLARIRFRTNDLAGAIAALDSVKKKVSEASYYKALFYTLRTNHTQAIITYEKMKNNDIADEWFFRTAYSVRESFMQKKAGAALIADMEKLETDRSVKAPKQYLYLTLAELYEKDRQNRNLKKAASYYEKVATTYPKSPDVKQAADKAKHIRKNMLEIR